MVHGRDHRPVPRRSPAPQTQDGQGVPHLIPALTCLRESTCPQSRSPAAWMGCAAPPSVTCSPSPPARHGQPRRRACPTPNSFRGNGSARQPNCARGSGVRPVRRDRRAASAARGDRRTGGGRIGRPLGAADVVVTHGSQQALSLLAQVLLDPGDVVVVEEPAYTGALQVFRAAEADVRSVPLDADGMGTDRPARSCSRRAAARGGPHGEQLPQPARRRPSPRPPGTPRRLADALRLLGDRGRPVRRDSASTDRRPRPSRPIRTG